MDSGMQLCGVLTDTRTGNLHVRSGGNISSMQSRSARRVAGASVTRLEAVTMP